MDEQRWLTVDLFVDRTGERFVVNQAEVEPVSLELVEVTPLSQQGESPPGGPARESFSLVFTGPLEPVLPDAIHHLDHEGLGSLDLFLVALGPASGAMRYEAVFT